MDISEMNISEICCAVTIGKADILYLNLAQIVREIETGDRYTVLRTFLPTMNNDYSELTPFEVSFEKVVK